MPRRRRRDLIAHRADVACRAFDGAERQRAAARAGDGEADARRRDVEAQGRAPGFTEQRPRGGAREDGHRCGYYGAIIVRSRWPAQPQQSAAAHGCSNCCWCQMMSCVKQRWGQTSSA